MINSTIATETDMTDNKNKLSGQYYTSKFLTVVMIIVIFVYILTSSIAFPILCKQFYYSQIGSLRIEETSGYSLDQIKTSYSEVIDYCIGARDDFAVGGLNYSEAGKSHFEDCRKLFILDLKLLAMSLAIMLCWLVIRRLTRVRCDRFKGRSPGFWGAAIELASFAIIGGLGSIDFDKTFVIFHSLFFPGKTNWIFDPNVDVIINILPEAFFMRCAIVIVGLVIVQSIIIMIADKNITSTQRTQNGI